MIYIIYVQRKEMNISLIVSNRKEGHHHLHLLEIIQDENERCVPRWYKSTL